MIRSPIRLFGTSARRVVSCGIFLAGIFPLAHLAAQLPTTQLGSLVPPGGRVGSSLEVRTTGADQEDATRLIFSHPGIKAVNRVTPATEFEKARPQPGVFDVQIGGDVPPGIYAARLVGRFGVSNPRAFAVGIYDESKEPGGNNQPASAAPLNVDSCLNGTVDGNQIDYFKLTLKSGQRLLIDCVAQRIDSRLDGNLVLYDASGKELARDRDAQGNDPMLDFVAPADGEYRLALHDFTYRGGSDYYYRLTVHSGPHIDFVFPPAGVAGSNNTYTVFGRNLPGGQPAEGLLVEGMPLQKLPVQLALPADDAAQLALEVAGFLPSTSAVLDGISYQVNNSNPVVIGFAMAPIVSEAEPNNLPDNAQQVSFPCEVAGQFYPSSDVDYFDFAAKKGEVYDIDVFSHRLGLPTDPILFVQKVKKNEQGEVTIQNVTQIDDPNDRAGRIGSEFDTSTDDPEYRFTADEDVTYRLMIRDQFGDARNDPRMVYRLAIHRGQPDFRLVAIEQPLQAPANPNAIPLGGMAVRKGGATALDIRIEPRYGFSSEVELAVEGLPEGVSCPNIVVPPAVRTGALIFSAAENAGSWAGTIRIVGRAKVGDRDLVRYARTGTAVWGAGNRQAERVSYRFTRDLVFSVMDRETQLAVAEVAENKVWETSRGGKLEIPIRVTRRGDFKDDLTLAPSNAPNELKPANLTIKGAESEGKLQLAATNGNLKPGLYTFYLRADAKMKYQRIPDVVAAAEQEKKEFEATIASLTELSKQAVEKKNAGPKLVQDAMQLVKQAEEAKVAAEAAAKQAVDNVGVVANALAAAKEAAGKDTENKGLADAARIVEQALGSAQAAQTTAEQAVAAALKKIEEAQAGVKTAQEQMAALEKAAADAEAKVKAATAFKAVLDKRVTDLTNANKPKDVQFAVVSTPVRVRIVESCLGLAAETPPAALKQSDKLELAVKVERLYGFDDAVEVTIDVPSAAKGLAAKKLTIPKGQAEGKVELTAAKDTPPGDYALTVRAKGRFNNIESQTTQSVPLKVEAVATP